MIFMRSNLNPLVLCFLPILMLGSTAMMPGNFKTEQLKQQRVREAYADKEETVLGYLQEVGIEPNQGYEVFLQAFKQEKILEVYVRAEGETQFVRAKTYDFCMLSGELGPKRKQGDYQVPEGFYHIDRFNPWSNFYLSLGINYPNTADRKLGHSNPGGDIFIHGSCVSIGCIPITDDLIKELYIFCVEARDQGQSKIPVYIFPFRMENKNWEHQTGRHSREMIEFWKNLQPGYDHFKQHQTLPKVSINTEGAYIFL